jgi:[ribosomal protein S5]-alanine N-acetyltransferase
MVVLFLPEKIITDRLVLERLRYEDAEEIFYAYASKHEATQFVGWTTHKRIEDTKDYLRFSINAWNNNLEYSYSIRLKGSRRLLGSFGIINDDGKLQFGYIFSPTQWNKGFATETCHAVLPMLRQNEVHRIYTVVDCENAASIRVLEKCGLLKEATLEKWHRFPNQRNAAKDCILFKYPLTS